MGFTKIIVHWTAGGYSPNSVGLKHYHYLIDGNGNVNHGIYKPEDNLNCNDGKYAAHTGGGNTGAIGVAMCGMLGFKNKNAVGAYPLKAKQVEACFKLCAELCKKYNIPIANVWTHYEFGKNHPDTTSAGKIDIIYLPPYPEVKTNEVGNFIRRKVRWYYERL